MPIMPVILLSVFISIFFVFLFLVSRRKPISGNSIGARLQVIQTMGPGQEENDLEIPFFTRVVKPGILRWKNWFAHLAPETMRDEIQKKLARADNPLGLDATGWIFFRLLLCTLIPAFLFILLVLSNAPKLFSLFITAAAIAFFFLIPNMMLQQRVKKQQKMIMRSLPDVLDLLTVSVEAGLSFDGAMAKVADKIPGQLSRDFNKVLNEIKIGRPRKDALKDMADQSGVPDLIGFVSAIIQADQLGVSLANVLRIQSEQIRQKRKQRIQEAAMKAPVKMLLPLVLFIFPTIFIILLGPAVIIAIELF